MTPDEEQRAVTDLAACLREAAQREPPGALEFVRLTDDRHPDGRPAGPIRTVGPSTLGFFERAANLASIVVGQIAPGTPSGEISVIKDKALRLVAEELQLVHA